MGVVADEDGSEGFWLFVRSIFSADGSRAFPKSSCACTICDLDNAFSFVFSSVVSFLTVSGAWILTAMDL
jgi:hypothetical protein